MAYAYKGEDAVPLTHVEFHVLRVLSETREEMTTISILRYLNKEYLPLSFLEVHRTLFRLERDGVVVMREEEKEFAGLAVKKVLYRVHPDVVIRH